MAKAKRASSGAWAKIKRINQIAEGAKTYTEAAKLLGISRRSLYNYRQVYAGKMPARKVMARKSTVSKYEDRLQSAATRVITKQVQYTIEGQKTPRTAKQAAKLISAGTGEKWSYQKVSALQRRYKKIVGEVPGITKQKPPPPEWGVPPWGSKLSLEEIESYTRKDYDTGKTRHYTSDGTKDGVRFMAKGENWLNPNGTSRGLIANRDKKFQTEKEVTNWVNDISNSKYVLVVVICHDANGNEYFEVWLDSDSV